MASEWKKERLSDLCSEIADCPHSTPLWTDSGALVLRSQNIRNGRLDLSAKSYTDEAHFEQRSRRARLRGGDLVITREAPMGEVCLIPDNLRCCLGQRMVMLRPDPKRCDSRFLLYSIQSRAVQDEIRVNEGTGSTVSNLRIPLLEALPITHPPLAEQKAIASILGALDDKIELNRRMNATLEGMARALFQSWFVDFDPVRAKLDGRKPEGLDKATAALFPDAFEDSSIGPVPKGWKVKALSELCQLGRGASPRPINDYMNGEVPWVKIADATAAGGPFLYETREKVKKAGAEKSVAVAPGDLILSNSATCGVPMFVELHGCIHDGWLYFKNLRSISKLYLFHVLIELAEHLVHIADGSVQKNLNTNLVGQQHVLVPPKEIADAFDAQATVWFSKMRQNGLESRTLATLRDTLLPKLLSGELSVASSKVKA